MQAWTRYLCMVGLAVIASVVLMTMQGRLDAPSSAESTNLEVFYSLSLVLSLPGLVIIGGFWALIGRAATLERQTRADLPGNTQ